MKHAASIAMMVFGCACAGHAQTGMPQGAVAITGVAIIRADGSVVRDATVLIRGDRITAVGPSGSTPVPRDAQRIDGRGKWMIPGMWDMHVHLVIEGTVALPGYVRSGVTSVRDMGGQFERTQDMRASIRAGRVVGPDIVAAGPQIESPKSIVGDLAGATRFERERATVDRVVVSDTASARRIVDSLASIGVDFIKVRNYASVEAYWAIARNARRRGLDVVGHAPAFAMDWPAVADSGQRSLEHWYYPEDLLDRPAAEYQRIVEAYVRNGTAQVPTMIGWEAHRSVYDSVRAMVDVATTRGTALGTLSPELLAKWRQDLEARRTESPSGPLTREQLGGWNRALDRLGRGIGQLHRSGVIVLPGSDMPPGRLPGEALLDEVVLFVEKAGFTPAEAIASATLAPAQFLRMQDSLGTIATGKVANLVLLDANPLENIRNIRRTSLVIVRGRVVSPPR